MAGRLTAFNDGGVLHTRLLIGLDFGVGAVGCEPIRIEDRDLDGHPLRMALRQLALRDLLPFLERVGEVPLVAHHGADALVVFTTVPGRDEAHRVHAESPLASGRLSVAGQGGTVAALIEFFVTQGDVAFVHELFAIPPLVFLRDHRNAMQRVRRQIKELKRWLDAGEREVA